MRTEDFFSRVDVSAGEEACWPWLGAKDWDGYGKVVFATKVRSAARVALFLSGRIDLDSSEVCRHTCDTPSCCNPRHLVPGTHAENMADKSSRNRVQTKNISIEAREDLEATLRSGAREWAVLAAKYGVSPRRVRQIAQEVLGRKPVRSRGERLS